MKNGVKKKKENSEASSQEVIENANEDEIHVKSLYSFELYLQRCDETKISTKAETFDYEEQDYNKSDEINFHAKEKAYHTKIYDLFDVEEICNINEIVEIKPEKILEYINYDESCCLSSQQYKSVFTAKFLDQSTQSDYEEQNIQKDNEDDTAIQQMGREYFGISDMILDKDFKSILNGSKPQTSQRMSILHIIVLRKRENEIKKTFREANYYITIPYFLKMISCGTELYDVLSNIYSDAKHKRDE